MWWSEKELAHSQRFSIETYRKETIPVILHEGYIDVSMLSTIYAGFVCWQPSTEVNVLHISQRS